jgi:hypothetical protein
VKSAESAVPISEFRLKAPKGRKFRLLCAYLSAYGLQAWVNEQMKIALYGRSNMFFTPRVHEILSDLTTDADFCRPFRALFAGVASPGLKGPTSQGLRRGCFFGVTYHNMRARHSVSDGGLGYDL